MSDRAAVSSEGIKVDTGAVSGLNMIAARFNPGAISESSLSHLPPSETSPLIPTNALYWTSRVSLRPRIGAAGFDRPLFTSRTVKLVQPISQIGVMVMAAEKNG